MSDRELQAMLARLPVPRLAADRKRALAAEVMARADLHDDTRRHADDAGDLPRRPSFAPYAIAAVAAAAVAVLVLGRDARGLGDRLEVRAVVAVEPAPTVPAARPAPPPAPTPAIAPEVAITEEPHPTELPASPSDLEPPPKQRQQFGATGDRQGPVIDRETRELDGAIPAFREGWEALRAGRHAEAIAAFDRATDPAVAEDAAFWAAIAAQRAGNIADARKRLADFLVRFPDSPRADRAREVLR